LDAITWVLFGQARKRDDSVINLQSQVAEVSLSFAYENNEYRVIRSMTRGKNTLLEFQISDKEDWRPLTEHSTRETQGRIERTLRLEYETFINVSFFLQGHADQFAQQAPTRRKDILGSILGLETWEIYKESATERRKVLESELGRVDGQIVEIDNELTEEQPRKEKLEELEKQLGELVTSRKSQEDMLTGVKQLRAGLEERRRMVQKQAESLEGFRVTLEGLGNRLLDRETERQPAMEILKRADEVEKAHTRWQESRKELEELDKIASRFNEHEKKRLPFLVEINNEKTRLEQERKNLQEQESEILLLTATIIEIKTDRESAQNDVEVAERQLVEHVALEKETQTKRERLAELRSTNASLKIEMDEMKARQDTLIANKDAAACPLCGQTLSPEHLRSTLEQLQADGKQKGDAHRANKVAMDSLSSEIASSDETLKKSVQVDKQRLAATNKLAQLNERLQTMERRVDGWNADGSKNLSTVVKKLETENYCKLARKKLAKVDEELVGLGYDPSAHDSVRRSEAEGRTSEVEYRDLLSARSTLKPLDDEIANLSEQISSLRKNLERQEKEHVESATLLEADETKAPNFEAAEQSLFVLQERESQLNQEVGAARQKVSVLDVQRKRKKKLEGEREELGLQIGRYKTLERAFGKDGVPALLIEQALPEIEMKANEILGRLSDDSMHLHFETQAKYKAEKRKDLRETLEIQVSDGAGMREYEMFSGGEAFRVNFAIRLALSEVLAQRKGARLQMLVIDEGFGSQDAQGRQRLIQSINAVRNDFAKILVITHLDELKDAFPTRIEVEKGERGSTVQVI
jgi:exonuclease SbcC